MNNESQNNGQYLDLRAPQPADKSFLGGVSLATRSFLFFLSGLIAMGAFGSMYYHVDQRMSEALLSFKNAQSVAVSVTELGRAIDVVGEQDMHVRGQGDAASLQVHRRAVDQIITALINIQGKVKDDQLGDVTVTIKDALSEYGLEISTMLDDRNILGLSQDTGLRGRHREMAGKVRDILGGIESPDLNKAFDEINSRADQTPVPASEIEQYKIDSRSLYIAMIETIESSLEDKALRQKLNGMLQTHSAILSDISTIRTKLATAPQTFEEILGYIAPNLNTINDYSEQLSRVSPVTFERIYTLARKTLMTGSAVIIVMMILIGLILFRSITAPISRLSDAVIRMASGERTLGIPLQGNSDELGDLARAIDKWLDNLAEVAHLKTQLEDAQMRLTLGAIAEAIENPAVENPPSEVTSEPVANDAAKDAAKDTGEDDAITIPSSEPFIDAAPLFELARERHSEETISDATKQLNRYNEYVNDAAKDVERTEILINLLSATTQKIVGLEACIGSIRSEANLLVFNAITPPNGSSPSTQEKPLIDLPEDDETRQPDPSSAQRHKNDGRRFEIMRAKVGKAEQMLEEIHGTLDKINGVAHDIAATASREAMDATSKLMIQSERLQTMLDELIKKVGPVPKS